MVIASIKFCYDKSAIANETATVFLYLTHFMPVLSFYTPWKHQETFGFLMFSGGVESDQWHDMVWSQIIIGKTLQIISKFRQVIMRENP